MSALAEQIERQERANAESMGMTYPEYQAHQAARMAHYMANKTAIDARIAAEDAEVDSAD